MIITLENQSVAATISTKGAELISLVSKKSGIHYLYAADGTWKRHSPVLFPNIGGMAEEKFFVNGKEYQALAHGFARDSEFDVACKKSDSCVFSLHADERTKQLYPFDFTLEISYALDGNTLSVGWRVINNQNSEMYFSIGAHPGFALAENSTIDDYKIVFGEKAAVETRRVMGRVLTLEKERVFDEITEMPLSANLFAKDALVLEDTKLSSAALVCEKSGYRLKMEFGGFPVVAFWTDPHQGEDIKFVCIEPWYGINALMGEKADELKNKNRITTLAGEEEWNASYQITIQ